MVNELITMKKINGKWVYEEPDSEYDHDDQLEMFSKKDMDGTNRIHFGSGIITGVLSTLIVVIGILFAVGAVIK